VLPALFTWRIIMLRRMLAVVVCLVLVPWLAMANNLLIGSNSGDGNSSTFDKYDDNGNFLATGVLDIPRSNHTATKLQNGSIFVAGGIQDPTSWEILDENGNLLSSGLLMDQRASHAAPFCRTVMCFLLEETSHQGLGKSTARPAHGSAMVACLIREVAESGPCRCRMETYGFLDQVLGLELILRTKFAA